MRTPQGRLDWSTLAGATFESNRVVLAVPNGSGHP